MATIKGTNYRDRLPGTGLDDTIDGLAGDDILDGSGGNDRLNGGAGDDLLSGGAGNDELEGGAGNDALVGGSGRDRAVYSGSFFDYDLAQVGPALAIHDINTADGDEGLDLLVGVEGLSFADAAVTNILAGSQTQGTSGNDLYLGNSQNNTFDGGAGNDLIAGNGGNDTLSGGTGNDLIAGGAGNDTIDAGAGDDTIFYRLGDGRDTINGGAGIDEFRFASDAAATTLDINASTASPYINFGANGVVSRVTGVEEIEIELDGGSSNVSISGDFSGTGLADETIRIRGTNGADVINASGMLSRQRLIIDARGGNDDVTGGRGNDIINGGSGNDTLRGGLGNDALTGGSGNDRYIVGDGGNDTITDLSAGEVIDIRAPGFTSYAAVLAAAQQVGGNTVLTFGPGNTLTLTGVPLSSLTPQTFGFPALAATNDAVLTNVALGTQILIPEWALLRNDSSLAPPATLQIANTIATSGGIVGVFTATPDNQDLVTFTDQGPANGAFSYLAGNGSVSGNASVAVTSVAGATVSGGAADEILVASSSVATSLNGNGSNDVLLGGNGNDQLDGGTGNDFLDGGEGSDDYLVGLNNGQDQYFDTGLNGTNRILATADNAAIVLNIFGNYTPVDPTEGFSTGIGQISANGHRGVTIQGTAGADNISFRFTELDGIASIDVGAGDDVVWGPYSSANTIFGGAGRDQLHGGDLDDALLGGDDDDVVVGNYGNDRLEGGAGSDTMLGETGNDTLVGGADFDFLNGGEDSDDYLATAGDGANRYIDSGTSGHDRIVATASNVVISLEGPVTGSDFTFDTGIEEITANGFSGASIHGSDSDDRFDFHATQLTGIAQVDVGGGNDFVIGSVGDDIILGNEGDDYLEGWGGNDTLLGGNGNDTLWGNGRLEGGAGDDQLNAVGVADTLMLGGDGNDHLFGYLGVDLLAGGTGEDVLDASAGNDVLLGGAGVDHLYGGGGSDDYLYNAGDGFDDYWDTGAAGWDRILANGDNVAITITSIPGIEEISANGHANVTVELSGGDDTLDLTATRLTDIDHVDAGAGNDTLTGSVGDDSLLGGAGQDLLAGGAGNDIIDGGADYDTARWAGNIEDYEVIILDAAQGQAIVRDGRPDLAGDDGADQLFNIESLRFANQTLYLDGTNNPVIARNDVVTAMIGVATTLPRLLENDLNYDGDVLTIVNVGNAQNGTVTLDVNGNPVFTAASLAPASFEYTVSDGRGSTSTATVTVNVTPENNASTPTLVVQAAQGNEDTAIPLAISAALTDTDGSESLAIRIENVPAGATLSAGTFQGNGVWTLTPAQLVGLTITPAANADADFNLVVNAVSTENNGGATATTSANLAVTVNSVNDAPMIISGGGNPQLAVAVPENTTSVFTVIATDVDNSGVNYSIIGGEDPARFTIDSASGALSFVSPPDYEAPTDVGANNSYSVIVQASDGDLTDAQLITVFVQDVDDAPVDTTASIPTLSVQPAQGDEDTAIALSINAALADTDGSETLAIVIEGVPQGATLSAGTNLGNGAWSLTVAQLVGLNISPPPDFDADFSLNVRAIATESNGGATAEAAAPLAVQVNALPDLQSDNVLTNVPLGSTIAIPEWALLRNDPDGGALQISSVLAAAGGTLGTFTPTTSSDDPISFALTASGNGSGAFSYSATDGTASATAGVSVTATSLATLFGGSGDEILVGSDQDDELIGNGGNDVLLGGAGDDDLTGGAGDDALDGGEGSDDYLVGPGAGVDSYRDSGGEFNGVDRILATADNVAIVLHRFNPRTDTVGIEQISANGHGGVTILGTAGDDSIVFGPFARLDGITQIDLGAGNDDIDASISSDTIYGGAGDDHLFGNLGDDALFGGDGDDLLEGYDDVDRLEGGAGSDTLRGGNGDDTLIGGEGNDLLDGQWGSDDYVVNPGDGPDTYRDTGGGSDRIVAGAAGTEISLTFWDSFNGIEQISSNGHGGVVIRGVPSVVGGLFGIPNNIFDFRTTQLTGIERIETGDGDDTVYSSSANDWIDGGAQFDTVQFAGSINDYQISNLDPSQGRATVADVRPDLAGDEGVDELFNVEQVFFSDYTLRLDGTNNSPIARGDTVTAQVGIATSLPRLLDNDLDFDIDTLTIIAVGNAQNGTVVLDASGNPVFTAASLAAASFEYTVSDGRGGTATTTVNVNVIPEGVASPPDLNVQAAQGNEDTAIPLAITAALTDTDGSESLAIRIENVPAGATLSAGTFQGNGVWTLTPAQLVGLTITPAANADADFNLVVNAVSTENNGGATATTSANLAVTVNSVNDAPVIVSGGGNNSIAVFMPENTSAVTSVAASDVDSTGITYSIVGGEDPAHFTIDAASGVLSFVSPPDFEAPTDVGANNTYSVVVQASDGSLTDAQLITVFVQDADDVPVDNTASAPSLSVQPAQGDPNTAIALTIAAALTDTDGSESLNIRVENVPGGATLSAGTDLGNGVWELTTAQLQNLTITPPANSASDFALLVRATSTESNGGGTSVITASLPVTVGQSDNPLTFYTPSLTAVREGAPWIINVLALDPGNSTPVTYEISGGLDAALFTIDANTGALNFVTAPDYENPLDSTDDGVSNRYQVQVRATQGATTATQDMMIAVYDSYLADVTGGANGFRIDGIAAGDHTGGSVDGNFDLNGDGFADVIVGASFAGQSQGQYEGRASVVFGGAAGYSAPVALGTLPAAAGFALEAPSVNAQLGWSVSGAGDFNNDGYDDVLVSAPNSSDAYIVLGRQNFATAPDLSIADGTSVVSIEGSQFNLGIPTLVANAGDVNGDGIDDILVANSLEDGNGGATYVLLGSDTMPNSITLSGLGPAQGVRVAGGAPGDFSGASIAGAGDFNGDGYDDVIIGAPGTELGDPLTAADAYVVFGGAGVTIANTALGGIANLDGSNGFRILAVAPDEGVGSAVASAGDINGDGFDDLIIGAGAAVRNGVSLGEAYVVFGTDAALAPELSLATLDGSNGFSIVDSLSSTGQLGGSVSSAGDFNGDGFDDLLVGVPGAGTYGSSAYIIYGKAGGFTGSFDLASLANNPFSTEGVQLSGVQWFDSTGSSVAAAGDVNGDGFDDVIVGAPNAQYNDLSGSLATATGRAYVVYGGPTASANYVLGDAGNNSLAGSEADEILVGGNGNDTLSGLGGHDLLIGGAGNDQFTFFDGNAEIRAGSGLDTLIVQSQDLDLTALNSTANYDLITGIERINLVNGSATNNFETLTLSYLDVLNLSDERGETGATHELSVYLDLDDHINFDSGWTLVDEQDNGHDTFLTYMQGVATLHINYIDIGG